MEWTNEKQNNSTDDSITATKPAIISIKSSQCEPLCVLVVTMPATARRGHSSEIIRLVDHLLSRKALQPSRQMDLVGPWRHCSLGARWAHSHFSAFTCHHLHFDRSLHVLTTDFYQGQHLKGDRSREEKKESALMVMEDGRGHSFAEWMTVTNLIGPA